jgi:signal transduction histidine kinase
MEVQLRHAQKLESIGSLAAGIAHEINTPTQYIGDNTTFLGGALPGVLACLGAQRRYLLHLQSRGPLPEEAAGILKQIQDLDLDYLTEEIPKAIRQTLDGIARVAAIVSAMKDFSHPGSEGKTLSDLNKAIESTLTVSRNEWKYVARLETDLDPSLPPVLCLQGEINQAILNLVVNASHAIDEALGGRHTGALGTIRVATRRVGQEVEISVADTGKGIPETLRERIFEPFFTTKPVGKGTGQGLAIVHAVVVEKHGGRVVVDSELGRGTTFRLFLPLGPGKP